MPIAGKRELFFGTTLGKTFNFEEGTYTDDGNAIAVRVRTKEYYLSGPDTLDEIQRVFIYADEPQGGDISISIDGGDYEFLGQAQKTTEPERFDIWKKCYHFSIGIDEISNNNIKMKGFNIIYEPQPEIL